MVRALNDFHGAKITSLACFWCQLQPHLRLASFATTVPETRRGFTIASKPFTLPVCKKIILHLVGGLRTSQYLDVKQVQDVGAATSVLVEKLNLLDAQIPLNRTRVRDFQNDRGLAIRYFPAIFALARRIIK